jgi:hypothetical protein
VTQFGPLLVSAAGAAVDILAAMTLRPLLAAAVLCIAMAGCGSEDKSAAPATSEDAAVAVAVKRYLTAMGTLNPDGVCDSLTPRGKRDLVKESGATKRSCEEVLRLGFGLLKDDQKRLLAEQAGLQPFQIDVQGSHATGSLQYRGQVSQFQAEKVGGVWKLSSPGNQAVVAG